MQSLNKKLNLNTSMFFFWSFLLVITLQIQSSFPVFGNQIRIGISDFIMPFLLLMFWKNSSDKRKTFSWNLVSFSWLPLWLILFSGWLGISLLLGFIETGQLFLWAFVNKFLGWFTLIGYLYLGYYISVFQNQQQLRDNALRGILISSALISFVSFIMSLLKIHGGLMYIGTDACGRFTGFLANPNTFGIFSAFMILLQIPFFKGRKLFHPWVHSIILTLNCAALIYSTSRGAWLMLGVGLGVFLYLKVLNFKSILFFIMLLSLSAVLLSFSSTNGFYLSKRVQQFSDDSVNVRLSTTKQALLHWQTSPIVGIGLGRFYAQELERKNPNQDPEKFVGIETIHNTFLWILTETGLIGLGLFIFFFLKTLQIIFRKLQIPEETLFAQGFLAAFLGVAIASLTSELLYQRYLWFFLGMILISRSSPLVSESALTRSKETSRRLTEAVSELS